MGKTVEQASAELRISRRYLVGIEEGDFGGWPERVFSTGFIRAYAKFLSQDPGPLLEEYERSVSLRAESDTAAQLRPGWIERERERGSRRATYTIAAGGVLLVGVILAWVTLRTEHRPLPPPVTSSDVAPSAAPAVENAVKTADNVAAATAPPASSVAAVGGIGPLEGPFQLFLEASEQAWLMYSFDDGEPIDVTLYAGDKISIQARKRVTLKLGNAGGVAGTLNGRRLPPFGKRGQVLKIIFGQ